MGIVDFYINTSKLDEIRAMKLMKTIFLLVAVLAAFACVTAESPEENMPTPPMEEDHPLDIEIEDAEDIEIDIEDDGDDDDDVAPPAPTGPAGHHDRPGKRHHPRGPRHHGRRHHREDFDDEDFEDEDFDEDFDDEDEEEFERPPPRRRRRHHGRRHGRRRPHGRRPHGRPHAGPHHVKPHGKPGHHGDSHHRGDAEFSDMEGHGHHGPHGHHGHHGHHWRHHRHHGAGAFFGGVITTLLIVGLVHCIKRRRKMRASRHIENFELLPVTARPSAGSAPVAVVSKV